MLPEASVIHGYYVYEYTFLDDLQFIKPPGDVFAFEDPVRLNQVTEAVKKKFLDAGWEGDGDIGILWLPPFVDAGVEDTWGTYIWHVKQSNNGISFLASSYPLEFARLAEQNRNIGEITKPRGRPVNIVETGVSCLRRDVQSLKAQLSENLRHVRSLPAEKTVDSIVSDLLIHYQGLMVRALTEFLDDCYLRFLIEVINNGNKSKIKLQKAKVQIDPNRYLPDEDPDYPIDEGGTQWLTVQGLITDLWKTYKFEPYKMKVQMLFGAIDFKLDDSVRAELMKHVVLRNCIQHHEGQLDKDSLRQCGVAKVVMREAGGSYELKAWDKIIFTEEELLHFGELLGQLAVEFSSYVDKRIPTREYVVEPNAQKRTAADAEPLYGLFCQQAHRERGKKSPPSESL
ncbi:MAG TPA: hypothetical protein VH575_28485 [Gemmataceae bacterium]|jgi:hypothetical protein